MELVMGLVMLFVTNVLSQPAFFTGLIVFFGLLAVKKPLHKAIAGFIKTAVGFYILLVGSNGLTDTFRPIIDAFGAKFNMNAAVVDTYFLTGQMYGANGLYSINGAIYWTLMAYAVAMVWNFILVYFNKYTKCRTLYVTGHTISTYTGMWAWFIFLICPAAQNIGFTLLFGILGGTWASVASNWTVEATRNLTGGTANFAVGHQEMLGVWFTDKVAHLFGNPEDSVENIQFPEALSIFKDNVVSTAILMTVFCGAIMMFIGSEAMAVADPAGFSGGLIFPVYILKTCLHFSVYMYILLAGVRMFVSELMTAFSELSSKVIIGSMPAVDCAVTYNYAHPNVTMIGFVFGFLGQLIAMVGLLVFKSPLFLIPGFVPLFFDNATIAVFANKRGGKKAAIICPLLNGMFQVLISLAMILFVQSVSGGFQLTAWPAFFDNNTILPVIMFVINAIGPVTGTVVMTVVLLGLNLVYYNKHKDHYYDHVEG